MVNDDISFMQIARAVGTLSPCYSRQIGVVLLPAHSRKDFIVGYNGPPRKVPHCEWRNQGMEHSCPRHLQGYPSGDGLHLCIAVHAEVNALLNAARAGVSTLGATLYCDCGVPCKNCLGAIINAGVSEVVYNSARLDNHGGVWYDTLSKWVVEHSPLTIRSVYLE